MRVMRRMLGRDGSLLTHLGPLLRSLYGVRWLLRGNGELEVLGLLVVGGNGDRGGLRPQSLVPCGDLISSRVEARDREFAVGASRREERMREHADVGAHPWVNVALDLEDVLRLGKRRAGLLQGRRHRAVERRIDLGKRVDVV